ncbi:DNA translocase FtsK [Rhizobiales bacterium]|uniref:FtsK/SpoIIIE family DNA translocase n=1 Tax=Hongsoonwoonella zoysiae TaxID=2821844 RepID=UPI0015612A45|nr:DNA translocase FtsK [Hongsoonwoonella zoysiae]NRG17152.1 DNA translocase FtsK [Hongsoonwoonella zoysiae]
MRRTTAMRPGRNVPVDLEDTTSPLRRFVKRNMIGAIGLSLIAIAAALAAALATWTVSDPSLNHATDEPVRNALGRPGAVFADLLMQSIGLATAVFLLPVVLWGWRLMTGRAHRIARRRVVSWVIGTLLAAGSLAALPVPDGWPLPTGLGGFMGDFVHSAPALVTDSLTSGMATIVGSLGLGVPALLLMLRSAGWLGQDPVREARKLPDLGTPYDDDDEDYDEDDGGRLSAFMGAVTHFTLHGRAVLRRLAGRKSRREYAPLEDWDETEEDGVEGAASDFEDHMPRRSMRKRLSDWLHPREDDGLDALFPRDDKNRRLPRMALPAVDDFDDEEDWDEPGEADEPQRPMPVGIAPPEGRTATSQPGEPAGRVVPPAPKLRPGKRMAAEAQPSLLGSPEAYELPPLRLLAEPKAGSKAAAISTDALEQNARILEGVLEDFGVRGEIMEVRPGPVVTLYELEPAPGIKSSRVIGLADDIARSMSAISARVAVIPGKNAIGIELPNQRRETVYLRELLAAQDFEKSRAKLALGLGKTINGEPVIADLARMPHLLVAGTTGSGKSVSINTMILSLLYRLDPDQCKLIMIDPKMLELSVYDGIPHLLTPVVTDPKKAVVALKWTVREMEERYKKMSKMGVRNIDGFNTRVAQALKKGEKFTRTVQTGFDRETGEPIFEDEELPLEPMPYIVVIVDEMADLMMVAGKDIEGAIQRLAQMARAAGIHLIMATQRPSVDVITGTIKANFPTRISFQVTSKIDSRTILGEQGAEQLLGQGDMLFMAGGGRIQRVHGPFVTDDEVEQIVAHLKAQATPRYLEAVTEEDEQGESAFDALAGGGDDGNDLYDKAVAIVLRDKKASTSYIQRRLSIGYNRAASIIERMEQEGVVGPANHAGKREILVPGASAEDY